MDGVTQRLLGWVKSHKTSNLVSGLGEIAVCGMNNLELTMGGRMTR